jgi:ABC-type dipeptide/oligopeptide/nickel transport system permease subunit
MGAAGANPVTPFRAVCAVVLVLLALAALFAGSLTRHSYDEQMRVIPDAPPSKDFPLGTDELGRDRLARLLYGARVSFALAPVAALLSVALAALLGGWAAFQGGWCERLITGTSNLTLSLPWLFLLMGVRAALPLNTSPAASVSITFALLGVLGWAGPAQVVRSGVASLLASDFVRGARSRGVSKPRILLDLLPNLRPALSAQFWTSVPLFILAEANLGMLGLGVSEPLPSLGNLLHGLESQVAGWDHPFARYWLFAPVLVLTLVLSCLRILFPSEVHQ